MDNITLGGGDTDNILGNIPFIHISMEAVQHLGTKTVFGQSQSQLHTHTHRADWSPTELTLSGAGAPSPFHDPTHKFQRSKFKQFQTQTSKRCLLTLPQSECKRAAGDRTLTPLCAEAKRSRFTAEPAVYVTYNVTISPLRDRMIYSFQIHSNQIRFVFFTYTIINSTTYSNVRF